MKPITQLPEHWQTWYQEWDANVPDNESKRRLQGELLGKPGSQQSYSAAFELFLFSTFNSMGLAVDFQPEINGVIRLLDLRQAWIWRMRGGRGDVQ